MFQYLRHSFRHPNKKNALLLLALYSFIFALCMPDRDQLWTGYGRLLTSQTYLMHDFTVTGGLAATFFNVSSHFLIAYILMRCNRRSRLSGLQVAATGIFVGHAFFGTHILNILPIIYGVFLYSRWTGQSFTSYTTVSLFATSTAPFVSFWALTPNLTWWSILLATAAGLGIGFISAPLAEQYLKFHQGFSLYNFGFTMGIIAMFASISFIYFKQAVPPQNILNEQDHLLLLVYLLSLLGGFFLIAICNWPHIKSTYPKLIRRAGRTPDDFISHFGYSTVFFNMALNGSCYLLLILLLGASLNGAIVGGFCSLLGFSFFGKHPRNCLPISAGILLAAGCLGESLSQSPVIVSLLFSTTLAPIAGYYGIIYGALAGFLHYNMVSLVLTFHQGMSLYNNGFAGGFVAAFLVPIYDTFRSLHHAYDE